MPVRTYDVASVTIKGRTHKVVAYEAIVGFHVAPDDSDPRKFTQTVSTEPRTFTFGPIDMVFDKPWDRIARRLFRKKHPPRRRARCQTKPRCFGRARIKYAAARLQREVDSLRAAVKAGTMSHEAASFRLAMVCASLGVVPSVKATK